jgi:peptidase MA superfamily protein
MKAPWILGAMAALALAAPASSRAQADAARHAETLIAGLDYDEARRALAAADPDDPRVLLERARLAIYELDCDGAAAILARPEVQRAPGGEALADIAHGCQRVTAALAVDRDAARGVEVFWQDEHDRALAPLLIDTVAQARDALTRDLGVDWPRPTRVVVVRDLLSLSAMTGLPYESAQTTGTVAVAKWGRVTLLSPRASHHGYPWRDTVAHELTHLAVTRASRDRAPLWLQEGVAKREEIRWRDPGPFDDRPPPEAVVQRGVELGLGVPLDKLGPSIAMLPSADAATIAFAEVTSFVRFYADSESDGQQDGGSGGALAKLFGELRDGKDPDEALLAASGADLKAWDARWRSYLASRPVVPLPSMLGLGSPHQAPHEADALRDLRDRSRLAQLLMARAHAPEALKELDRIELARAPVSNDGWNRAMGDPSVRWLRGRALEEVGRREEAEPLMGDPAQVLSSYGPWWAMRGRWARARGDEGAAATSFHEAVAADPLDPEGACETLEPAPPDPAAASDANGASVGSAASAVLPAQAPATVAPSAAASSLCAAARQAGEPPFDAD